MSSIPETATMKRMEIFPSTPSIFWKPQYWPSLAETEELAAFFLRFTATPISSCSPSSSTRIELPMTSLSLSSPLGKEEQPARPSKAARERTSNLLDLFFMFASSFVICRIPRRCRRRLLRRWRRRCQGLPPLRGFRCLQRNRCRNRCRSRRGKSCTSHPW